MVMKKLTIYAFLIFTGVVYAKEREVTSLEIVRFGMPEGISETEKEGCSFFKPTKEQIIEYLEEADWLNEGGELLHQYYSPCFVTGKVTFKDGFSGEWTIKSSGYGRGSFNYNDEVYFFREKNGWFDPFQCLYYMGDEPDPDPDCEDRLEEKLEELKKNNYP